MLLTRLPQRGSTRGAESVVHLWRTDLSQIRHPGCAARPWALVFNAFGVIRLRRTRTGGSPIQQTTVSNTALHRARAALHVAQIDTSPRSTERVQHNCRRVGLHSTKTDDRHRNRLCVDTRVYGALATRFLFSVLSHIHQTEKHHGDREGTE